MSCVSGKCDFLDHLAGLGGWFDCNGNSVKFGQEGVGVYYSDIMLDFIEFKKRTGGVIYQHKKIKEVNRWNQDFIKEHCSGFEIIEHREEVADKRHKSGHREDVYYTYKYYNKEYTAKELSKRGVYITVEIHIDNLVEAIPYFPYIVSACCSNEGHETIYLSNESYVEEEYDSHLQSGFEGSRDYYNKRLAQMTREIVLNYFNPTGREVIEDVEFELEECKESDTPRYIAWLHNSIDDNFKVEWLIEKEDKTHWTSPEIIDAKQGLIAMSKEDFTHFIGPKTRVKYVKYQERNLHLQ